MSENKTEVQAAVPAERRQLNLSAVSIVNGSRFMPATMAEALEFAMVMAKADFAVPPAFRQVPGACLAVTMQALRWDMDPFAVVQKAYVTKSKDGSMRLAYEAQLVNAVVNTRAPIVGRVKYKFDGEGPTRRCIVNGRFVGEDEDSVLTTPMLKDIHVQNSPLWKSDPDQQLSYYGGRAWGRRFCPEVLLGVYTPDEVQSIGDDPPDVQAQRGQARPTLEQFENVDAAPNAAAAEDPKKDEPKAAAKDLGPKAELKAWDQQFADLEAGKDPATGEPLAAAQGKPPAEPAADVDEIAVKNLPEAEVVADPDQVAAEAFAWGERVITESMGTDQGCLGALTDPASIETLTADVKQVLQNAEVLGAEDRDVLLGRWNTAVLERQRTINRGRRK